MEGCELSFRFKLGADFLRLSGFDIIFDEGDLRTLKVGGIEGSRPPKQFRERNSITTL